MSQSYDELVNWLQAMAASPRRDLWQEDKLVCAEAADAIAALRRDAERLDWLDEQCSEVGGRRIGCLRGCLRASIDANMPDAAIAGCKTSDSKDDTLAVRHDAAAHDEAKGAT